MFFKKLEKVFFFLFILLMFLGDYLFIVLSEDGLKKDGGSKIVSCGLGKFEYVDF